MLKVNARVRPCTARAKSKNYSFTMMLCINRYEIYTRASCNSFQTSCKVLKRCNYQMIRYGVYNVIDSVLSIFKIIEPEAGLPFTSYNSSLHNALL